MGSYQHLALVVALRGVASISIFQRGITRPVRVCVTRCYDNDDDDTTIINVGAAV